MLHLYQSNRLETLGTLFAAVGREAPLADPFEAETVIVQSRGMGRWLTLALARENGVSAHVDYVLPAAFAWQLMQKVLPGLPRKSPFAPEVLAWRLMQLWPTLSGAPYEALTRYLAGGEAAAFELAGKVADVFDQYLVFRPEWIRGWEAGQGFGLGEDEAWQAALWRQLAESDPGRHRVRLLDDFLGGLRREHLPERVTLFGIASLAPMYLAMVKRLSELTDVCLFTLNPCAEYWGDLAQARRQGVAEAAPVLAAREGHPLLASLGRQGRDFFDLIAGDTDFDPHPLFTAPDGDSLLARLQRDLLTLDHPGAPGYQTHSLADGDDSVAFGSAHGPLRELEMLKDRLLARFAADPTLTPADVVVLTPDINAYAPFIDSVFAPRDDGAPNVPYTIADRTVLTTSPVLAAFEAVLELADSRFEADRVLALLDCDALLARFGLDARDVPLIHDWVRESGIRWGRDAAHKAGLGLPSEPAHSWRWGLDRLLLGAVLPDALAGTHRSPLFGALLPMKGASGQLAETLARFARLVDALCALAEAWAKPASPAAWAARLRAAADTLMLAEGDDEAALAVLFDACAALEEDAQLARFQGEVGLAPVRDTVRRALTQSSGTGFLAGRVTFCAMVPMRSIPFRLICLIGMNDGAYPRDERPVSFDLIARSPKKGDRSRRFDDRYLFLEAILSAREALYLSWVGRSARSDEPLPPSALVSELADCLGAMCGGDVLAARLIEAPLQAFSRDNYRAGRAGGPSFEPAYYQALVSPKLAPPFAGALPIDPPEVVPLSALLAFWRNPVKGWLGHALGVRVYGGEEALPVAEPFSLGRDTRVAVRTPLVEALFARTPLGPARDRVRGMGLLPPAALGEACLEDEVSASARFAARLPAVLAEPVLPPLPVSLSIGGWQLFGELTGLRAAGLIAQVPRKANAAERVALWLNHLVLCACAPGGVLATSQLVAEKDSFVFGPMPSEAACELLAPWLAWFAAGVREPLPFFARTSLAAAGALEKPRKGETDPAAAALQAAYAEWAPPAGSNKYPQRDEIANERVWRDTDPLTDVRFMQMVEVLLRPMVAAETGEEA